MNSDQKLDEALNLLHIINSKLDARTRRNPTPHFNMDEYEQKAIEYFQTVGRVSVSGLQRHFSIGYAKAASIVDHLEEKGIVSPHNGHSSKGRSLLQKA